MRPLGLTRTLAIYGVFAIALFVATRWGIPTLVAMGFRPDVSWFIAGGVVLAGFVVATIILVAREGRESRDNWRARLRIKRMAAGDWWTAFAGLVLALGGVIAVFGLLKLTLPSVSLHPPFLAMRPLGPGEYWVLLAWAPMFALNILGEEAFGRGCLLPRNELVAGSAAWLVNGSGWLLFHVAFGPVILALAAPLIFATCWAAQKAQNTTVAMLIHGLVNGPTFVAMSVGLLPA